MLKAYEEGKDLYCVIAQSVFDNEYEDNLEFYKEGKEVELDGKTVVSGSGQEKEVPAEYCEVPYFYLIPTPNGEKIAKDIIKGEKVILSSGEVTEVDVEHPDEKTVRILAFADSTKTIIVKSPPRLMNKAGKERRSSAKTLLLALLYGMSAETAGKRMGKTAKEGQALFDNFFAKFPKVKELVESSKANLSKYGYVEDWAGRRRHLDDYFLPPYSAKYADEEKLEKITFNPIIGCKDRPPIDAKLATYLTATKSIRNNKEFEELAKKALQEKDKIILSANTGRIAQAERQCLNARIQGGAASLTKLAMVNIFNDEVLKKYQAKLIITVHDEVLVECPEIYAEEVEKRLPQVMVDTAKPYFNVPMKCDPYNVYHWYSTEYSVSIQAEFGKLKDKVGSEAAFAKVCENHPEFPAEKLRKVVFDDEEITFD